MRAACAILFSICATASAQNPIEPQWRRPLMNLPAEPAVQDLERFETNVRLAGPYFATLTPGDYEANRELMRRMVGYLAAAELTARTPQMRAALGRAYGALAALRYVYPQAAPRPSGGGRANAPPQPAGPPFELQAPEVKDVSAADQQAVDELRTRYDLAARRAATAWQNAETLRLSLESNGMSLNPQTATSVARLQLYLELAAGGLHARDWTEARENLERAEYETEKVVKAVGR